jgi:hypothetical protein
MNLKKLLKILLGEKAQASLEYFIIFALIGGLTILGTSAFLANTRTTATNLYTRAVNRILHPTNNPSAGVWYGILQSAISQNGPASAGVTTLLNALVPGWTDLYGYAYGNGQVQVGPGNKFYFVIDPSKIPGLSMGGASIVIWMNTGFGPSVGNNMSARLITVDKNGNQISDTGNQLHNNAGYLSVPYNSNYSYIIELSETQGIASTKMDVCWGPR